MTTVIAIVLTLIVVIALAAHEWRRKQGPNIGLPKRPPDPPTKIRTTPVPGPRTSGDGDGDTIYHLDDK